MSIGSKGDGAIAVELVSPTGGASRSGADLLPEANRGTGDSRSRPVAAGVHSRMPSPVMRAGEDHAQTPSSAGDPAPAPVAVRGERAQGPTSAGDSAPAPEVERREPPERGESEPGATQAGHSTAALPGANGFGRQESAGASIRGAEAGLNGGPEAAHPGDERAGAEGIDGRSSGADGRATGVGGGSSVGAGSPRGASRDRAALEAHLRAHASRCYPPAARKRYVQGGATLHFCIGADGKPDSIEIEKSSGSSLLDRAAIECVLRGAAPLPGPRGCMSVPIWFRL